VALRQPSNVQESRGQWKGSRYNFRAVPTAELRLLHPCPRSSGVGVLRRRTLDSVGARLSCSLSSRKLELKARRSPRSLANAAAPNPPPPLKESRFGLTPHFYRDGCGTRRAASRRAAFFPKKRETFSTRSERSFAPQPQKVCMHGRLGEEGLGCFGER